MKTIPRFASALIALLVLLTACTGGTPVSPAETALSPTAALTPLETAVRPSVEETLASPIDGDMTTRIHFVAAGDNIIHEAVYTDAKAKAAVQASAGGAVQNYAFAPMYD